ncbi:MAG TPA: hypothetical protein VGF84_17685 [Micromonosporaceae bacterium]|jgi:hypothetical protein
MLKLRVAVTALAAVLSLAIAAPAYAGASPAAGSTKGCTYHFTGTNVRIHTSDSTSSSSTGEGQTGQVFSSLPWTTATAGGYNWVKGTDTTTNKSGWVVTQYLSLISCHLYY